MYNGTFLFKPLGTEVVCNSDIDVDLKHYCDCLNQSHSNRIYTDTKTLQLSNKEGVWIVAVSINRSIHA